MTGDFYLDESNGDVYEKFDSFESLPHWILTGTLTLSGGGGALRKRTVYTSGSDTHTPDASAVTMDVQCIGGGSGGMGSSTASPGTSPGASSAGGNTTFGTMTANGGAAGDGTANHTQRGALGGAASGGDVNTRGEAGHDGQISGGPGGGPGGGRGGFTVVSNSGEAGAANTGGGGGGAAISSGRQGGGGGHGGYCRKLFTGADVTATAYAVGAGSSGGLAGTSGAAGATGGSGIIVVDEYW